MQTTAIKQIFLLLSVAFLLLTACKDQLVTEGTIVFPDSSVSYGSHIEPLFTTRCLGCHNGAYPPNLSPPSYSALVTYQPQLIIPGQGNNSLLVQLLDGRAAPIMPPSGEMLNQNQINGIKTWIDEGALNN